MIFLGSMVYVEFKSGVSLLDAVNQPQVPCKVAKACLTSAGLKTIFINNILKFSEFQTLVALNAPLSCRAIKMSSSTFVIAK